MLTYLAKRLLLLVPVMICVATLVFFLQRCIPGDPIDFILGENAQAADRQALASAQNFDKPLLTQYAYFWRDLVGGSLGQSYFSHQSVISLIAERLPATMELAVLALCWSIVIAIPLGVLSAVRRGRMLDHMGLGISLLGISIPSFYLGPLLVLLFSIHLDWFPVSGRELTGSAILPSLTLGAAMSAVLMRMTRSSLIDVLEMDYVRTARAKGVSPLLVIVKHALRSALVPVVAILGLQFGTLLAGAIVTEKIFAWPGLGSLLLEAIGRRDYAVVQGCVLVISLGYVVVNLMTDLFYTKLDPRIELEGS